VQPNRLLWIIPRANSSLYLIYIGLIASGKIHNWQLPKMSQRKTLSKPYACQKPSMDRNCCLIVFLLYICHTVIHRKLQNVVYMKKKLMLKKKQSEAP
jgi:hypothetical protein